MPLDEQNGAEPADEIEAGEPDPLNLAIDRLEKRLEKGDFLAAKAGLDTDIGRAEEAFRARLEKERMRLRVDPVAIVVMAVCGSLLAVVTAATLFN